MVGISNRGARDGLGFRFLWIHPFEWLKSNIGTILILPDSGRLRFPRNIWVGAGGGRGASWTIWGPAHVDFGGYIIFAMGCTQNGRP